MDASYGHVQSGHFRARNNAGIHIHRPSVLLRLVARCPVVRQSSPTVCGYAVSAGEAWSTSCGYILSAQEVRSYKTSVTFHSQLWPASSSGRVFLRLAFFALK